MCFKSHFIYAEQTKKIPGSSSRSSICVNPYLTFKRMYRLKGHTWRSSCCCALVFPTKGCVYLCMFAVMIMRDGHSDVSLMCTSKETVKLQSSCANG